MSDHKKSPSVAAHGAEEIQMREMLCAAILPAPPVDRQCSSCGHTHTISAGYRPLSLCRFTGEKVRLDDPTCFAWPCPGQGGAA